MSCNLIDNFTEVLVVEETDKDKLSKQLDDFLMKVTKQKKHPYSLFVLGDSLIKITEYKLEKELVSIADHCASFVSSGLKQVACRVSPKQKQELVQMVRDSKPDAITLAIGDGANDVNMISGAHIGVGIKGLEGSQAARISDFAIGEFKLLRRLVLGYGRECYRRNCDLVSYFFYKNLIVVLPQIWIAPFSGFSGQIVYEAFIFEFYNICFTSMPILVYALTDVEFDLDKLQNSSSFYKIGQKNERFNTGYLFSRWISRAAMQSIIICFFGYITIEYNFSAGGLMFDYWTTGMAIFTAIIVVANLELFLMHNVHACLSYFCIFGTIVFYFGVLFVFSQFAGNPLYQIANRLVTTPQFYMFLLASIYTCNVAPASINKVMRTFLLPELFREVALRKGMVKSPYGRNRRSDYLRRYTGFAYSG